MTPRPLENLQGPMIPAGAGFMPSASGQQEGGSRGSTGSISLGMLFDFIIQRTYHDLTVLAEL